MSPRRRVSIEFVYTSGIATFAVPPSPPRPVEPEELRAKYAEMLAMRLAHEAGTEDGDVQVRMAELARRYPGALREIDELELHEIRGRIEALEASVRGEAEREPWMLALGLFHALMRGALCAKRWLAGRKVVDGATERAFAAALGGLAFPADAGAWQGELAQLAVPPGGRVSNLVFERLARHMGISESEARRLVFGFEVRSGSRTRPPATE